MESSEIKGDTSRFFEIALVLLSLGLLVSLVNLVPVTLLNTRTTDCGSTILSEPTYRDAVQQELQLDKPLGNRLRSQLEQVENLDELRHFSLAFQPLTLGMKKIWSFSEFRESHMKVKVVVPGPGRSKRTTSTTVKSAVSYSDHRGCSIADGA